MRIVVFPRRDMLGRKRWYFHVKASNGRIVAQSEGYVNRYDCIFIVGEIRRELPLAKIEVLE